MLGGVDRSVGLGMKQLTLAAVGFERYAKTTRRAAFLDAGPLQGGLVVA